MNLQRVSVSVRAVVLGCVALLLASSAARAQWLPDRNYTEGPGFRLGDLELHPGIAARAGYDTNVFRTDKNRIDSAIFALTAHLNIKTLGRQRATQGEDAAGSAGPAVLPVVTFNAGLAGTLLYYFENRGPKNVEVDTEAKVSFLPERVAGFDLGIDYARGIRPFAQFTGSRANDQYARNQITPSGTFRMQSRSGVLRGSVGYVPTITIYESGDFEYLNTANHGIAAGASWKFLPYTALIYDGGLTLSRYFDPRQANAVVRLTDSDRFVSRLGINGAVTQRLAIRGLVGYAMVNSKLPEFDDKEDVVAEVAVRYGTETNSGEIGYQRDVQFSNLGSWLQQDRGYLKAGFLAAKVFALNIEGGVARANYGRLLAPDGTALGFDRDTMAATSKREDLRLDGGIHAEYRATNWLALMADVSVLAVLTDFRFGNGGATPFPAQFTTVQAFGGVRVHY